ncbi:MAG: hypothetical protein JST73_09335 [Actinobacteria bacterium]|nr:hypothetical protein [Actinomycetota bacterium]
MNDAESTNTADVTDATARTDAFITALPAPPDPSRRDTALVRAAAIAMAAGTIVAIVAVVLSQGSNNPLDQSTQLAMAVAGLAVTVAGGAVFLRYSLSRFLRYWLLVMVDEQHRGDDRGSRID